jgi:hypothetical protein
MLALPLKINGEYIDDATGTPIAECSCRLSDWPEYAAQIVAAVNSQPKLLAAAKRVVESYGYHRAFAELTKLQHAIAAAEAAS